MQKELEHELELELELIQTQKGTEAIAVGNISRACVAREPRR